MDSNWLIESAKESHKQKESYLNIIVGITNIEDANYAAIATRFHMSWCNLQMSQIILLLVELVRFLSIATRVVLDYDYFSEVI